MEQKNREWGSTEMTAVTIAIVAGITAIAIAVIIDNGITTRTRIRAVAANDAPASKLLDCLFGKRGGNDDNN